MCRMKWILDWMVFLWHFSFSFQTGLYDWSMITFVLTYVVKTKKNLKFREFVSTYMLLSQVFTNIIYYLLLCSYKISIINYKGTNEMFRQIVKSRHIGFYFLWKNYRCDINLMAQIRWSSMLWTKYGDNGSQHNLIMIK